ncbi:FitA-like ribbon-helix-helix domain-containing protein [Laspinema olomoucense]|uniref:FitA-like ribbon-helix-helix domain-containing protein n=1 Tax=Laspinema olomoucense TaxID=3231600 RepID=UPI0021BA50D4|nr:hypothetical protein [Laspinema sp. D3a]MCT7988571.1 hypothetical protein [Laspinema sp. D3a]
MNQLIIENLDPKLIEKLQHLARQHDRTVEAEVKAILEGAIAAEAVKQQAIAAQAWEKLDRARAKYAGRTFSDSAELLREDRT